MPVVDKTGGAKSTGKAGGGSNYPAKTGGAKSAGKAGGKWEEDPKTGGAKAGGKAGGNNNLPAPRTGGAKSAGKGGGPKTYSLPSGSGLRVSIRQSAPGPYSTDPVSVRVGETVTYELKAEIDIGAGWVPAPDGTVMQVVIAGFSSATATISNGLGTGFVAFTSAIPTVWDVRARTTVAIAGTPTTRESDGVSPNGPPVATTFVNARISIAPNQSNHPGSPATLVVTVQKSTDFAVGFVAAPGETVDLTLIDSDGGTHTTPTGGAVTNGSGQTTFTFTSPTEGHVICHAACSLSISGSAPIRVETDGVAGNSPDAVTTWDNSIPGFGGPGVYDKTGGGKLAGQGGSPRAVGAAIDLGRENADEYDNGATPVFGVGIETTYDLSATVLVMNDYVPGQSDWDYLARLPFHEAQDALSAGGAPTAGSRAQVGWYGVPLDPEQGSFAVVRSGGPFAALVGKRVRVSYQGVEARTIYAYVRAAIDRVEDDVDIALTRMLFVRLAPLPDDFVIGQVDVMGATL